MYRRNLDGKYYAQYVLYHWLKVLQEVQHDSPICWRHFSYELEAFQMLEAIFKCIYVGCSPKTLKNKKMKTIIENVMIDHIIPESVAPHFMLEEIRISNLIFS